MNSEFIIREREKTNPHPVQGTLQFPEVMPDHIQLLVEMDPQFGIHRLFK